MSIQTGLLQGAGDTTVHATRPAVGARSKFYFGMAVAMTAVVFIGFAPSFYLNRFLGEPLGLGPPRTLPAIIIAHGLVFTAWMVMLVLQTGLAANGRIRWHRQLGVAGAGLAALVVIFGSGANFVAMQRDVRSGAYDGSPFLHSVVFASFMMMIAFAGMAGAAIYLRRSPQTHKRLVLLATIVILGAATGRIGRIVQALAPASGPLLGLALTDLFLVALAVHDWRAAKRLYPATLYGSLAVLMMQVLSNGPLPNSPAVVRLVHWLSG